MEGFPAENLDSKSDGILPPIEAKAERKDSPELEEDTRIKFSATDHSLRHPESVSKETTREIYAEMKKEGIDSIRFDWDWEEIFSEDGKVNQQILDKYIEAMRAMKEEGLEPPTIVMSSPPKWATDLLKEGHTEEYLQAYKQYVDAVAETIRTSGLEVKQAQLFNEINHPAVYNFFGGLENFPTIAKIVRDSFTEKGLGIEISTSIIVANSAEATAALMRKPGLDEFLREFEKFKDCVDVISLDYYPGMWHLPIQGVHEDGDAFPIPKSRNPIKELGNKINRTFKNTDLLKHACEVMSDWGKDYELGESGFPTNEPYSNGRRQRLQYDMYFRALGQMFEDFKARGVSLPRGIGIYETQDEDNRLGADIDKNPLMKWLKGRKIFPESHFGLRTKDGEKKEILQGNLHDDSHNNLTEPQRSQLRKLIDRVRKSVDRKEEKKG
jgi:hypothetical protein